MDSGFVAPVLCKITQAIVVDASIQLKVAISLRSSHISYNRKFHYGSLH